MIRRVLLTLVVVMSALLLASCGSQQASPTPQAGIPNPASVYCEENGGEIEMRQDASGGQAGICVFPDGSECDEWAYYRGECEPGTTPATGSTPDADTPAPEQALYSDPFAYCAAMGTVDVPDARYNGPEMPDSVIQGLIQQGIVTADAPPEFQQHAVWRCMDGQVWACHFGANLPCQEKGDASQDATAEMEAYCKENPSADAIPAAVTGRATVYEWKCSEETPQVVRQLFQVDPQGYLADFWYQLAPQ